MAAVACDAGLGRIDDLLVLGAALSTARVDKYVDDFIAPVRIRKVDAHGDAVLLVILLGLISAVIGTE